MARVRVLLADDHQNFLELTTRILEAEFDVVKVVSDGQAVIDEVTKLQPDVLVLDITMPVMNGIAAATQVKAAGFPGKIVFLTVHGDPDYVSAARAAGALGYVVKSRLATDLLPALRDVLADKPFASPNLSNEILDP